MALYRCSSTALVQDLGVPINSGKRNPCLHIDLHGISRYSFPILTDTPKPISLVLVRQPRIHQRSMGAPSGSDGKTPANSFLMSCFFTRLSMCSSTDRNIRIIWQRIEWRAWMEGWAQSIGSIQHRNNCPLNVLGSFPTTLFSCSLWLLI